MSSSIKRKFSPETPTETICRTKIRVQPFSMNWTIENFSFHSPKVGDAICSETFPTSKAFDYKWLLRIYPYGNRDEDKGYVGCYLYCSTAPKDEVYTKYTIAFRSSKNTSIEVRKSDFLFSKTCSHGWARFVDRDDLLRKLDGDSLNIHVEVTVSMDVSENDYNEFPCALTAAVITTLSANFASLLNDSKHSDVTFCVEGKELTAHQLILCARSKVFAAMFHNDTLEKQTRRVQITDFDYETVRGMLEFMYAGKVSKFDINKTDDLLCIAEKYELEDLKKVCCASLVSQINTSNAVKLLILADTYNEGNMKEKAIDFICAHANSIDFDAYSLPLSNNGKLMFDLLKKLAKFIPTAPDIGSPTCSSLSSSSLSNHRPNIPSSSTVEDRIRRALEQRLQDAFPLNI